MAAAQHAEAGKQPTPTPVTPMQVGAGKAQPAPLSHGARIDPRGLTPRVILDLQRTVGNRAVNVLLQRYASAPLAVQREDEDIPIIDIQEPNQKVGPSQSTVHDTQSYETEPIRKQARENLDLDAIIFADLWLTAGTNALASVPEAEDEESKANWYLALAGNLLWAATSLVASEAKAAVRLMSFVGAAVGSGVGKLNEDKAPSGKELIGGMLTKARDHLVKNVGPVLDEVATKCGDQQITNPEEQRKVLWPYLFRTDYNESDPIREEMTKKIKAGLAEYLQQWHAWKKAYEVASWDDRLESNVVTKVDKHIRDLGPFRPNLSFGD
jgi:hypothetical protein